MKTIAIVGFGRFGQVLYRLFKNDFHIVIYDTDKIVFDNYQFSQHTTIANNVSDIYNAEVIFYAVPIASFEAVIQSHQQYFTDHHLLVDVLSVKLHPKTIFERYLKGKKTQALLTHPMFGPDSAASSFADLPIVLDQFKTTKQNFLFWKKFFQSKGLRVVLLPPDEHDRLAANSQGVAHFIGRLLQEFHFAPTSIDTAGAKLLHELQAQTCNDSWELFLNLQNYNPYTKAMRLKLGKAYDKLYNKLLPQRTNPHYIIYGIQGGICSFNEEAIRSYTAEHSIKKFNIRYLYTSERVLNQLHRGNIDYGLFAVHNLIGGVVWETVQAMSKYKFTIVNEFAIRIRHFLMKRPDVPLSAIDHIMAHPQVFAQCKTTLATKYPHLQLESGKGDLVDTAKAAEALAQGKLVSNYAILGPQSLSKLHDLEIIAENLQDDKDNYTSFFLVSR